MVRVSLTAAQVSRSADNAHERCKKVVETYPGTMPAATFQDQQVQQLWSGPEPDGLADDADLPHQGIRSPGPQGSRTAAAYSYKLLPLQPPIDSDWSRRSYPNMLQMNQGREASLHGQYAVKRRMYPLLPTRLDPQYVVCQHCLQLLVLPLNFPPLTRNTQKLRCSDCTLISIFSAELIVGRSATIGDLPGVSDRKVGRIFSPERPSQPAFPVEELLPSVGRNFPDPFAPLMPAPLPSPPGFATPGASTSSSIYVAAPLKGKDVLEDGRRSFEIPISLQAGSESESDSIRNGLTLGNLSGHPLSDDNSGSIDEQETPSAYPPSISKDQEGPKGKNKVANMFKGLKDFTKTGQGKIYRRQVYVNSRAIPDPLVKKAEEYAGPIHPGQYWYDVRAGFWGVMGGPCKGIIPPFIEELNHLLPRDSSGGKTGVVVNGRELHFQDLEILSSRGLPTTRGMSYQVEIDGRVTDDSGQELTGLGRLAPSVEKRGRGHGMVVK